jgi:GNAT superfamily N-acetyltransferase
MRHDVISTRARPDLAEVTGQWRWVEFFARHGRSRESVIHAEREAARTTSAMPHVLVSLADGEPVGMATLAAHDLDARPDLGPWLAGVYVLPAFRGRGHATHLVGAIEDLARAAVIPALWLYTRTAEPLYRRCGWCTVERFPRNGHVYDLMRRDLSLQESVPR